jgi:hypothetical protein
LIPREDRKRLNKQDLKDLKEIEALEEIATLRAKEPVTDHSTYLNSNQQSSGHEVKKLSDQKWYLDID